jgi:hypothetical protein
MFAYTGLKPEQMDKLAKEVWSPIGAVRLLPTDIVLALRVCN